MRAFLLLCVLLIFSTLSFALPFIDLANAEVMNGSSVNVSLEPSFQTPSNSFKVTFLEPATGLVQVHVDYDFTIIDNISDEIIYKASIETNQPLLHTTEGIVTIPYEFANPGKYAIKIDALGINFIPILPETFTFPLQVSKNGEAAIKK